MKILILQDYLRSGGTERQSVLLANAFAAAGHATTLLTFRPGGALAPTVSAGVAHHALQSFDTGLDWFAPGFTQAIERFQSDVVLCMGRMANCYGQFIVKEVQDRWPHTAVIGTMRTGKKIPWLFRFSLRHVHHVVANSAAAKKHLVSAHALPPEKISVIHNSLVFSSPLAPKAGADASRDQLREQHGAKPTTAVLLSVAMFRPEKNQRELVEVAAGLPADFDWQLWLAGEGPARSECERLAGKLGVSHRVKFLGFQADPTALYTASDIAVHASRSESLSNFLIEAQAHGLPAVAFDAQGIGECFIPGDTGEVIPPGDVEAFRRGVRHYARADRGRALRARAFAQDTFDTGQQVRAYLELFSRLTGNPIAPSAP